MPDSDGLELVTRAQGGDVDAIGALYDQHHDSIFRYVWSRVGDRRLAEDLTGDVFAQMLAALPNYRPSGTPFR
ncbi:MAG TPA: sigma factor, partial [Anaerolineae bacterium]|nr:sigma factor [Anaerolineae bacterium]